MGAAGAAGLNDSRRNPSSDALRARLEEQFHRLPLFSTPSANAVILIQIGQKLTSAERGPALRIVVAGAALMVSVLLASCQGGDPDTVPIPMSCGDGVCGADESCASCARDCGA
jgi:hypothetical protein